MDRSLDKALNMGKTSALGSVQLFLGKMLSTIILAIGSIILTILISEGDYGLYIVALIPATTALLFQDLGSLRIWKSGWKYSPYHFYHSIAQIWEYHILLRP